MKHSFFFLLIAIGFWACGSGATERNKEILSAQTWTWDVKGIKDSMSKIELADMEFNTIMGALRRMEGSTFNFNKDGSLVLRAQGETYEGEWELQDGGNSLLMALPSMSNTPNKIVFIEKDRFVLGADKPKGFLFPKIFIPAPETAPTE